jgi:Zn-dependent alcohol dehydrogenase
MLTRSAVALEAGKPLVVMDVHLDAPRAGEVLVEIKASGICHTDQFTLSGADPEGLFPAILGHEGAGVVLEVGQGPRRCRWSRHSRRNPARHSVRCPPTRRQADQIVGVDLNPARVAMAKRFGVTDFVNPSEVTTNLVDHLVALTRGGADSTFDATGNVGVMRTALEAAHKGWGVSIIIGVAPAGAEISTRPFQLVTGRSWRGTAFGGARGRTDVPKIVDWYMAGKIEIDPMSRHTMPLDDINKGFAMLRAGESIRSVVLY